MNISQKIAFLLLLFFLSVSCDKENKGTKLPATPKGSTDELLTQAEDSSLDPLLREKYLDSAYTNLESSINDSVSRLNYRRVTSSYYNLELYDKSLKSGKKIFNLGVEANDSLTMARSLYYTADSHYGKANMDSAFYYYTQAQTLYKELDKLDVLGEIILYKAYVYYNVGDYALCETEAVKALGLLEKQNKITHIYNCLNLIATALDGQNNNDEAIEYFEKALKQLEKFSEAGYTESVIAMYKASCYNNMGLVYEKKKDFALAISIYREALGFIDLKTESPSLYAKLINNLAHAKFKSGEYSNLPDLFFTSLKIRDSLDNQSGIITSNINLGEYYAFNRDTIKAINYLKNAYAGAKDIRSHFDILNSLKMLSEIDKENSVFYYNRYITVSDSLQDIAKQNRDKFARIEYETDKLQDEKEALVKKNSFIIGISAVILLFIAAVFIIYYLNSRNKELLLLQEQQKANEEIYQLMFEQQSKIDNARTDEKNRIAMELHDGILNNIYAVRLNLEFINKKADEESILKRKEFIKELQNVETEIRTVSHDLSRSAAFQQDKSFKNMLEFMIGTQKNKFMTQFEAEVDDDIEWEKMSNFCKVNVYRIVQESLQNINKYSEASHAWVNIKKKDDSVAVIITDNGQGFDTESAKSGIGIRNLKKRAASLHGKIDVISKKGEGSTIKVEFPI